jgi:hypothetical protein
MHECSLYLTLKNTTTRQHATLGIPYGSYRNSQKHVPICSAEEHILI